MAEYRAIQIYSPVPLELTDFDYLQLREIITRSTARYEEKHPGQVCWLFGEGSLMTYMPMTAEEEKVRGPEFDTDTLSFEIACREKMPGDGKWSKRMGFDDAFWLEGG